jgi:hypothetical protein
VKLTEVEITLIFLLKKSLALPAKPIFAAARKWQMPVRVKIGAVFSL